MKRSEIRVRDPYIVLDGEYYYMYITTSDTTLSYYRSTDLEEWEEGGVVFEIPENFWAYRDVWAGEVHKYKGKYYLFVSLLGRNGIRGTQIAVCDTPYGKFLPLVDRAVTPLDKSCIDGSFFVSDGKPYIFYSHDWPDNYVEEKGAYVGEIYCAELTDDLTAIVGEPVCLFASCDSLISGSEPQKINWRGKDTLRYGSDAPFVQKLSSGALYLTWSPYLQEKKYVVLGVISESGSVFGPWKHSDTILYSQNGGHAMFFTDKNGRRIMSLHAPEQNMLERAHLYCVEEDGNGLRIKEEI